MNAKTFEDLLVWQKAHQFVLAVYRLTKTFPKEEIYGLSSQFRRAAVSIAANIAEGFRRRGDADKLRFLNIAQGSLAECKYYVILSRDLGYGGEEFRSPEVQDSRMKAKTFENVNELMDSIIEVSKMLDAYCASILNSRTLKPSIS